MNRGPHARSALDLKHPDGVDTVLRRSSTSADALIEGFRPGVMERLGLGPDVCLARNPKLVFGRMTGWGQEGPYAPCGRPRHQLHLARRARSATSAGPASAPVPPLNLVGDFGGGGMLLAFGVVVRRSSRRSRAGKGQVIDAAMVDGAALLWPRSDLRLAPTGVWSETAGHEPARHRRALLRRVRDVRRQVHRRSGRSSRSSTAELLRLTGLSTDARVRATRWTRTSGRR